MINNSLITSYYKWHRRMVYALSALICCFCLVILTGFLFIFIESSLAYDTFTEFTQILSIVLFSLQVLAIPALIPFLIISIIKQLQKDNLPADVWKQISLERYSIFRKIKLLKSNGTVATASIWMLVLSLCSILASILAALITIIALLGIMAGFFALPDMIPDFLSDCLKLFYMSVSLLLLFPHLAILFFQLAHKTANTKLLSGFQSV